MRVFTRTIVVLTVLSACATIVSGAPSLTVVSIFISGGNALVFSDNDKRVDIGPVKDPSGGHDHDFVEHPMKLILQRGNRVDGAEFMPATGTTGGSDSVSPNLLYWSLEGYEVAVCPGGKCPTSSNLKKLRTEVPKAPCGFAQATKSRNLYFIPNLLALHKGSSLKQDWPSRMSNRFILQDGEFAATTAVDCFEFRDTLNHVIRRDALADGDDGAVFTVSTPHEIVDVQFSKNGAVVGKVRLVPTIVLGARELVVKVATDFKGKVLKPNDTVDHFRPFYELLDMPVTATAQSLIGPLKLVYTPAKGPQDVNPGSECPMGRFGGGKF